MPPMCYNHTGLKTKWHTVSQHGFKKNVFVRMQLFTCNCALRTWENTLGYLSTKPCGVEVWGPECSGSPIPSIPQHKNDIQTLLKQLAGLWSDNEPGSPTHRHSMFSYLQAWLDRKQTHTNTSEFSGSVGHQCAELQTPARCCPAISCADRQDRSVASRGNSGFFYLCLGSESCCLWLLETGLLLRVASDIKESLSPYHRTRKPNISFEITWLLWMKSLLHHWGQRGWFLYHCSTLQCNQTIFYNYAHNWILFQKIL